VAVGAHRCADREQEEWRESLGSVQVPEDRNDRSGRIARRTQTHYLEAVMII
jgi:hypothetical protein